jgi:hypothetical protein
LSEIRANTISDAAGTGPITLTGQSAAKAWINIPDGQASINQSFNVSSLEDDGTGDGKVNFVSSMADANYAFTASNHDRNASSTVYHVDISLGNPPTVSRYAFESVSHNTTTNRSNVDMDNYHVIHGDLA